mmetsp:Transcript_106992/g.300980  ORF Transcript_106992/g.300980 Transcript_106992/m.300980 type:complete len:203 (-) Transcript_106992:11-619(-)
MAVCPCPGRGDLTARRGSRPRRPQPRRPLWPLPQNQATTPRTTMPTTIPTPALPLHRSAFRRHRRLHARWPTTTWLAMSPPCQQQPRWRRPHRLCTRGASTAWYHTTLCTARGPRRLTISPCPGMGPATTAQSREPCNCRRGALPTTSTWSRPARLPSTVERQPHSNAGIFPQASGHAASFTEGQRRFATMPSSRGGLQSTK